MISMTAITLRTRDYLFVMISLLLFFFWEEVIHHNGLLLGLAYSNSVIMNTTRVVCETLVAWALM
jgi:hypothetical protein